VNIDNGFGAAQVAYRIATAGRAHMASRDAAAGLGVPSAAVEA
jgi:hypothetical protein